MSNGEGSAADALLEPLTAYKRIYKESFRANCEEYFEDLVKQSGIDAEANRRTVASYEEHLRKIAEVDRLLSRSRGLKGTFIFLIVLGAILLFAGIVTLVGQEYLVGTVLLLLGAVFLVLFPLLLAKKTLPVIRQAEEKKAQLLEKANALKEEAYRQMEPLNSLFEGNIFKKILEKTVPLLSLDENFNLHRYDYLNGKYGYGKDDDPEVSTVGILSGEILGNPFVEEKFLIHRMGSCIYHGSIVISWETEEVDMQGHLHTHYHTQTLTASVEKPKPYYSRQTRLVYGNEAAPDLSFTRTPTHAEDLSEGERERRVREGLKKLRKMQQRAVQGDGNFTEMGNADFDVLFGALDRDNEVQFRLLFTPLAQKNMLELMTDSDGFGDDFSMKKFGCLNYISSEHSQNWDMEERRDRYFSYSVDISKKKLLEFQQQNFENLYFDLAPLLSIPLYQQHKPREYLYRDSFPGNYTRQETECAVNRMADVFAPPNAATESILKTTVLMKEGRSDYVNVTAYAYETVERVDLVPMWGGDGMMHDVPVHWTEYIPVSRDSTVRLKEFALSDRDFESEVKTGRLKQAILSRSKDFSFGRGIFCCVSDDSDETFDSDFNL